MANNTRPYSSPNYPKEEKKEKKKETQKRGNPGTPYTPGVDGGGTNPGHRGNPGTPYTPPYQTPSPTPYTPPYQTNTQQQNNNPAASSQPQNNQQQQNQQNKSNTQQQSVQQTNARVLDDFSKFKNEINPNTVTLEQNTKIAKVFNTIQINHKKAPLTIMNKAIKTKANELYKAAKAEEEEKKKTQKFEDMYGNSAYWYSGRKQSVSYATSIDYYNMSRSGFKTVYVEEGDGELKQKNGIFTIGRNKLEGLPGNVKTVLVDYDNNWKYLVDTTHRAEHVATLENKRAANTAYYEDKITNELTRSKKLDVTLKLAHDEITRLYEIHSKQRTPENLENLNNAIDRYNSLVALSNESQNKLIGYGKGWAERQQHYDNAINNTASWTVEDEAHYQQLRTILDRYGSDYNAIIYTPQRPYSTPNFDRKKEARATDKALMLAEFAELTKRREAGKDSAAFMNLDTIASLNDTVEQMGKVVDDYNAKAPYYVSIEEGQGIGQIAKRLMFTNPSGNFAAYTMDGSTLVKENTAYNGIASSAIKGISPFKPAIEDMKKAKAEYYALQEKIDNYIDSRAYQGYDTTVQYGSDDLKDLIAQRTKALEMYHEAYEWGKNTVVNNFLSNLTIFDMHTFTDMYVAWKMQSHPERYEDDPKYQKLQNALKYVYGEGYRVDMDAGKAAMAILKTNYQDTYGSDYIYLDSSDLRYKNGEHYGFFASLMVSMLTDADSLLSLGKLGVNAALKLGGTRAVAKSISDSFIQAMVRSDISQEAAEQFVKSKSVQSYIKRDVKQAINKTLKEGGDDFLNTVRQSAKERAKLFGGAFVDGKYADEVIEGFDALHYEKFLRHAEETVANSGSLARRSFLVEKGTVLSTALGSLDDILDNAQRAMFKLTCPAAGAVTGIAKANKLIREWKINKLASPENIEKAAPVAKQLMAIVNKVSFDDCLDGTAFATRCSDALAEYEYALKNALNSDFKKIGKYNRDTVKMFSDLKDIGMQSFSTSTASNITKELKAVLKKDGINGLEDFAKAHNFVNFEEMFANIEKNIEPIYEYSNDAKNIIDAFRAEYQYTFKHFKMDQVNLYVDNAESFLHSIKAVIDTGSAPVYSLTTVRYMPPEWIQGISEELYNGIHDFMCTVNNDYTSFINATGDLHSVFESAQDVMEVLEDIKLGDFSSSNILNAQILLEEFADELDNVYIKNLKDWQANAVHDAFGVQDYLDTIEHIAPEHAGSTETINKLYDNFDKFFKEHGNDNPKDVVSKFITANEDELMRIPMQQRQATIYRLMESKGSALIRQSEDANFRVFTESLTDCNSQFSKNCKLIQIEAADEKVGERIKQAFNNACAAENTRIINDNLNLNGVNRQFQYSINDVLAGNYNSINRFGQMYNAETAAEKAGDYIIDEVKKQVALHNGEYKLYTNLGCNTVDVGANTLNIEKNLAAYIPEDEQYLDICVSMLKSTDETAPKDIAFHIRGAEDAPSVFRKDSAFTVYDDRFATRTYGRTAQQLNDSYAALGDMQTLTTEEWISSVKGYINNAKQQALAQNKTIRFIGFNTSDSISSGNKFISDVIRSCGVNANTANAIDLADLIRMADGEYVFNSSDIRALKDSLTLAYKSANAQSAALNVSKNIAYDPKCMASQLISEALEDYSFSNEFLDEEAAYIVKQANEVTESLKASAYNDFGISLGTYIDATECEKLFNDLNITDVGTGSTIMKNVVDATAEGQPMLNIKKIINTQQDAKWVDYDKFGYFKLNKIENMERIHDMVLSIDSINNGLRRTDILKESDRAGFMAAYDTIMGACARYTRGSFSYTFMKAMKVADFDINQLYSTCRHYMEYLRRNIAPDKYDTLMSLLLVRAPKQASYLSDRGYKFLRDNIVDYTNDALTPLEVKYLKEAEGYKFAESLNDIRKHDKLKADINNHIYTINKLFNDKSVHGVQDKLISLQMASVYNPILKYQDELETVRRKAERSKIIELDIEAENYFEDPNIHIHYTSEMKNRIAVNSGVTAANEFKASTGAAIRSQSIAAVAELNEEAFKAHIARNCLGGLVIEPGWEGLKDTNLALLFDQWRSYGAKVEAIDFTQGTVTNRKLYRVYFPEFADMSKDELFAKYNHTNIDFNNKAAARFNDGYIRHSSFGASDMTLMNKNHCTALKDTFFSDVDAILDINENFSPWANELYNCSMWTSAEVKQFVNPYYTDDFLSNLAQSTQQLRNNISAVHDLGSVMNNEYMKTSNFLRDAGVLKGLYTKDQREFITKQINANDVHVCKLVLDKNNKYFVVDYTPKLLSNKTNDKFFEKILDNTIILDSGMMLELSDWATTTSCALKLQTSNVPEWLGSMYTIYKKTIRSATVAMYLYGSLGTAVRNYVDSSTKGLNEVMQYNEDTLTYLKRYRDATVDVNEYSNLCRQIEDSKGIVNKETIAKYYSEHPEQFKNLSLDRFNIFYGYEHTCGGDSLVSDMTIRELHQASEQQLMDALNLDVDVAKKVRKTFDGVYGSTKYYGMTNAQLEKHMVEIHDKAMDAVYKNLHKEVVSGQIDLDALSKEFYNYKPTVTSWGDQISRFPVLNFNRSQFNNAETRARLAIYQTFIEGGASEAEAMRHVTATQFHYAGIGKVEDFMPFTQYKLYNALYWFDHANSFAVKTAWRAAQYNGDGSRTTQEIHDILLKYRQKEYYLYERGADKAYDNYYEQNIAPIANMITDEAVDSYLGVPRTFNAGNLDLNGTHYIKLGNSFIEELDLVATCMIGAYTLSAAFSQNEKADKMSDKLRMSYQALKCTPLYDSFYSPWKGYIDLVTYAYDHSELINYAKGKGLKKIPISEITSKDIADLYEGYLYNKSTQSEAIAMIPVAGAVLSNMLTRWKNFDLNSGLLAALYSDPNARAELSSYLVDAVCGFTGMLVPSVVGTKVEVEGNPYNYYVELGKRLIRDNPATYLDFSGRLQREMGFTAEQAEEILSSMKQSWEEGKLTSAMNYHDMILDLFSKGYDTVEITNLFKQNNLPEKDINRFLALYSALPDYIKYDKKTRDQIIAYYKATGLTTDQAWAKLVNHPAMIINGKIVELTRDEIKRYNEKQNAVHSMITTDKSERYSTEEQWDAYWDTINQSFYYPPGKWKEARQYLERAGYTFEEACDMLLHGYILDENGMLIDAPGRIRARVYSYNTMKDAEWDAYWNTVPDYTKYEKGAFGRTMKALKKMGYTDDQARALIQQGLYANKDGTLMNVTGMERPVLGFPSFNAYYQSIPEYCRYEKGAFKRTYAALKSLGFDYETSLMLIQQGAYLMDLSMAQSLLQTLGARRNADGSDITVTNINTLLARYGGQIIISNEGKPSVLIDCSGLTRPRKTYSYARRGRRGGGGGYSGKRKGGRRFYGGRGRRRAYTPKPPKPLQYKLRKPFLLSGNVSTFSGMTNFRGSNNLGKPYATKGYVSTYSAQNFLNGSSYGMRKTYKIDMRQFKSGALSTKSAYPTSYRNIAVAYRRNMYKDLYAKYGMSRMRMRANKQGYSNAAITRLRRNEIQNRERYDERRDQITKTKTRKKASV